jgi:hypothetical protein
LAAQAGPAVASQVGNTARALDLDPKEADAITLSLKIAGLEGDNLTETMARIGEASKATGVPMKAIEQVIERIQTGAHASWADMRELTLATNGASQAEANQFRQRAAQQEEYLRTSKAASEASRTVFQQSQEKAAGQDLFAQKTGIGDKSFADFVKKGGFGSGAEAVAEQQRPRSFDELWGGKAGEKALAAAEMTRYKEGIAQLAKEGGSTHAGVMSYLKAGQFDRSDVMSAAGRSRTEAEQTRVAGERQTQEAEAIDYQKGQDQLRADAVATLLTKTPAKTAEVAAQKATPEGQAQHVGALASGMRDTAGNLLIRYADAVMTAAPLQGVAGAVQNALPNPMVDRVDARLRQGGLDPNTILGPHRPGQAQPSALPGKEGSKVEDPKTHELLSQLLKIFGS